MSVVGPAESTPTSGTYWKYDLMLLQELAPTAQAVERASAHEQCPPFYGLDFHGVIPREAADQMLSAAGDGAYLIRQSQRAQGGFTLCMRFDGSTKNYRLFYDGLHYVGEKRFSSVDQLVADGLICMYLDKHASDYIQRMTDEANYEEAPYTQHQRRLKQQKGEQGPTQSQSQTPPAPSLTNRPQSSLVELVPAKAHRFKAHTFKAHFCDYCGNFMWGLVQQGVRCEDCGFAAHRKCSEKAHMDCQPDLKYVRRMFSVDLCTLCMAHSTQTPPVVLQCVQEVESRGLFVEGIYRISGSFDEIEQLRAAFDLGSKSVDLSPNKVEDIHSVAGLLKLYLRVLPQPLVTYSVYTALCNVLRQQTRNQYDRLKQMKTALHQLPLTHLDTLRLLLAHLNVVAEHCAVNKMTAENLATVFAPTVLCQTSPQNMAMALPQQEQYVMHQLILHAQQLLGTNKH